MWEGIYIYNTKKSIKIELQNLFQYELGQILTKNKLNKY